MSNKDNFGSGFILGTIVGGVIGGVIGSLIANQNKEVSETENDSLKMKKIKYMINDNEDIVETKINLEEKINQLNHAIDEVRFTLLKNHEAEALDK
jgi:gas vesicle protein